MMTTVVSTALQGRRWCISFVELAFDDLRWEFARSMFGRTSYQPRPDNPDNSSLALRCIRKGVRPLNRIRGS
jgi:hypothetical protein